jgi:hypothetical protein
MIANRRKCSDLGAADLGVELGATDHSAELGGHVSATSTPFVANSFNLSAKIHGAETCYLDATVHGAELRAHFLKSFQKRCICENLSTKGSENKKDGWRGGRRGGFLRYTIPPCTTG